MNKKVKDTCNRSDIEKSLSKEFPNLTKLQISDAIDEILNSIIEAVLLMKELKSEALELFQKIHKTKKIFKSKKKSFLSW